LLGQLKDLGVYEKEHSYMQYHSLVTEVNQALLTHGPTKTQKR
jgi:hypothetical protein